MEMRAEMRENPEKVITDILKKLEDLVSELDDNPAGANAFMGYELTTLIRKYRKS